MLTFRLAAGEVSGPVFTSTATSARVGSIIAWPPPGRGTFGSSSASIISARPKAAKAPVPLGDLVGRRVGPVAPGGLMRVGTIDQQFRPAGQVGQHRLGQRAHRADVLGDLLGLRCLAGRAQDQAEVGVGPAHRLGRKRIERLAHLFVADAARDVAARRTGGDDGVAALEQQARGDRQGLAGLGRTADLHQHGLAGGKPRDLPQKARSAGQPDEDAALPLHGPVDDGAKDGARSGLRPRAGRSAGPRAARPPSARRRADPGPRPARRRAPSCRPPDRQTRRGQKRRRFGQGQARRSR